MSLVRRLLTDTFLYSDTWIKKIFFDLLRKAGLKSFAVHFCAHLYNRMLCFQIHIQSLFISGSKLPGSSKGVCCTLFPVVCITAFMNSLCS